MGVDWESILDASETGLDDAYDAAVSAVMYPDGPQAVVSGSRPVGEAHDETDSANS